MRASAAVELSQHLDEGSSRRIDGRRWRIAPYVALILIALALWLAGLEQRALWDPDEGRYAEIPREMVASGDWTTPRLNDLLYFEKPPLQYWATAAAYALFGQHNWTARLWVALTGLGGVLLAFYAGVRLLNLRAALYAAAVLASGVLYFGLAHINTLDMGLSFFLETVVFGFAIGLRREASAHERRLWIHVAWAAAGLAVLSKGLIGLVLPLGALVGYSLLYRDFTIWRKMSPLTGGSLLLLIAVPWFVAVARANPDFMQFFFVHEHFTRFLTTQHHREQPWWFFGPVLVLGALPWTGPMLVSMWRALADREGAGFRPFGFLAVWVIVVFSFFSVSGSKLVPYILPVFPALALLGARYLDEAPLPRVSRLLCLSAMVPAVAFAVAPYALRVLKADAAGDFAPGLEWEFFSAAALWLAGGVIVLLAARRQNRDAAVIALALAAMAAHQIALVGAAGLAPAKSTRALAQQMKPHLGVSTRVYLLQIYPQSLPVYLERTMTLVEYRGELDFGLTREPHKSVANMETFREMWPGERDAVAVMTRPMYRELSSAGLPMTVIAQDVARIAVRRP